MQIASEIERVLDEDGRTGTRQLVAQLVELFESYSAESAEPKEAGDLKLGSRLTVEGVEAVVVPAEPSEAMAFCTGIVTPSEAAKVWRAMLSAAGDGNG